jgi:hypothetical protein
MKTILWSIILILESLYIQVKLEATLTELIIVMIPLTIISYLVGRLSKRK